MKDKTFDELINQTNELINKLNSPDISMDEAMKLFEIGMENIKEANKQLETNKVKIQKILEDNKIEAIES